MRLLALAVWLVVLMVTPVQNNVAFPITIAGPNSAIKFDLSVRSENRLSYRITLSGRPAIERSRAGIIIDGINLGEGVSLTAVERTKQDERYRTRGIHSTAVNRYNGAKVALLHQPSGTRYSMEIRAFDDGAAFRYVVPSADTATARIPDEASVFNFPPRSTVWYHDLDGHYEGVHEKREIEDVPDGDWAAPPVTTQLPEATGYASITEAGLKDYAGMVLQTDRRGGFAARLAHAAPASYPYRLRYPALDVRRLGDRPDFDDWANSVTEAIEGRRMSAPESVSHSGTDTDPDGEGLHRPGGVESTRDRNSLRGRLNESGS